MQWDEEWTKSQAWGCPMTPQETFKRYKRQSLGMPMHHHFIKKHQVTSQYTIFLLFHILCAVLGAFLFCFVWIKWSDPSYCCSIILLFYCKLSMRMVSNKLVGVGTSTMFIVMQMKACFDCGIELWLVMIYVIQHILVIIVLAWLVLNNWECFSVPLLISCFVFIKHKIVVFSSFVSYGLTWHMLTPCYDYKS